MAEQKEKRGPGLPLAVSLAVVAGLVVLSLFVVVRLIPNQVRCVVKDSSGTIQQYGITWAGVIDKPSAVKLVTEAGATLWTRCGLRIAAPVKPLPVDEPYYLQTAADNEECGNLMNLTPCDELHFPLVPFSFRGHRGQ